MKTNQELIESLQTRAAQLQQCNELSLGTKMAAKATRLGRNIGAGAKTFGSKAKDFGTKGLNKAKDLGKTAWNKTSKPAKIGLGLAAGGAAGYGAYRGVKRAAKDWRAEEFYMPTYNGYTLVNEADKPKFGQVPSKFTKMKRAASDKLKAAGDKLKTAGSKAKNLGIKGLNKAKTAAGNARLKANLGAKEFRALPKGKKAAIIGGGLAAAGAAGAGIAALRKRKAKNESYTFNEKFSN